MEKLCVFCKEWILDVDYIYYSTLTGGDMTKEISCKHKPSVSFYDEDDFRAAILRAETCEFYKPAKDD